MLNVIKLKCNFGSTVVKISNARQMKLADRRDHKNC